MKTLKEVIDQGEKDIAEGKGVKMTMTELLWLLTPIEFQHWYTLLYTLYLNSFPQKWGYKESERTAD